MKFPVYGHFGYVKKKSELKFEIEDYLFIIQLRANKDLDLDTLFELAYSFAKKHQHQLASISNKVNFQDSFGSSKNFLRTSYFSAVKDIKDIKNYNYPFFDLPPNEAGESMFDEDDEDEEENDFDLSVLSVSDIDGELYFLEPFSILKPIRILTYSLDRPEENVFNYRNWRPTNFTTDSNQAKGYFYGYDPSVSFNYEFKSTFGYDIQGKSYLNSDAIVRTVRYWQFKSTRQLYLVEAKDEKNYANARNVRLGMKNMSELDNELDDDDEDDNDDFDTLIDMFYNSLESYPGGYIISIIAQHVKSFSSDIIFPDWFSALVFFNVVFFISDYVSVFFYWYFPFLLNFVYDDLASFSKTYYIYAIYVVFAFLFILYIYILETLTVSNLVYKVFIAGFTIFTCAIFFIFFVFPFSIIFLIAFSFFFFPIMVMFVFLQIFTAKFHVKNIFFFLPYSNPESVFGYYVANYYFSQTPVRFSKIIFFNIYKTLRLSVRRTHKSRAFYFKPSKIFSISFLNKRNNHKLQLPTPITAPIYYPNTFSDISFQQAIQSRIPPPPHAPLLPEDDIEYNNDTPFAPDLTGNRTFYFHPTIDHRLAPENATQGSESHTNYQSLFEIENDWGQFVEDAATHSQGYWYPSSMVFSPTSLALYHPYIVFHTSFFPFFQYYQLKIFLNALQIEQISLPRHRSIFSIFVLKKFFNNGFSPFSASNIHVYTNFSDFFKSYPSFYKITFFFTFFINLLFVLFNFIFSIFLTSSKVIYPPVKIFKLFFFPAIRTYRIFLRFYFKILKNEINWKTFGSFNALFRFFFLVYFLSIFFPAQNYYTRIRKISSSVLTFFFHFLLFVFRLQKCVIRVQTYLLIRLMNFCAFTKPQLQLAICGILEFIRLFV